MYIIYIRIPINREQHNHTSRITFDQADQQRMTNTSKISKDYKRPYLHQYNPQSYKQSQLTIKKSTPDTKMAVE